MRSQIERYIPVPTGNSPANNMSCSGISVYPCTYRELATSDSQYYGNSGISLYLQGTPKDIPAIKEILRYIPVPTGNSKLVNRVLP